MKTIIISTLTVGIASAVGGFFLGKNIQKKNMELEFNRQLEELQNYYKNKDSNVTPEVPDGMVSVQVEDNKPVINTVSDILKDYKSENSDAPKPKRQYRKKEEKSGTINAIRKISLEEYGNSRNTSETLVYYSNGVLTNGDGEPLAQPENYIGESGLAECGEIVVLMDMGKAGEDLYFRNEVLAIDFEVQILDEPYSD